MNIEQFARNENIGLSTLRARLKKHQIAFDKYAQVTDEILPILRGAKNAGKQPAKKMPAPPQALQSAPQTTTDIQQAYTTNTPQWLLDIVTICELLLVITGATWLFSIIGFVFSVGAVAFYAHTALEMRRGVSEFAQDFGLMVCGCFGCVFAWLHGQTFWKIYDGDEALRLYVCAGAGLLLSLLSFCALYQTRNVRA